MAFAYRKVCKVCVFIADEAGWKLGDKEPQTSPLFKLINLYHSKGTTIQAIADEYYEKLGSSPERGYASIRNHAIKHQHPSPSILVKKRRQEVAKSVKYRTGVVASVHHSARRSAALAKLEEAMLNGELKGATFTALAQLLKQEADIEEKQKDRNLDILRMMTQSRSGEVSGLEKTDQPFDPWQNTDIVEAEYTVEQEEPVGE